MKENEIVPKKRWKKILLFLILSILFFYVYIRYLEPNWIKIHEQAIYDENLPFSYDGLKITHFSDLLYGETINKSTIPKVVTKINELNSDIVIFTGDLLNDTYELKEQDIEALKENLKNIHANIKKYAVIGDNDAINKTLYLEILESSNFLVLDNQNDLLYYEGNDPILFVGTASIKEHLIDIEKAKYREKDATTPYYTIWLSHEPTIINEDIFPNLIFAGHTLKGLTSLPFKGFLLNQEEINEFTGSQYQKQMTRMYISNGLGTYKIPIRFLNRPSINFYRLYKN